VYEDGTVEIVHEGTLVPRDHQAITRHAHVRRSGARVRGGMNSRRSAVEAPRASRSRNTAHLRRS
jgi:hypothetical protein